MKMNTMNMPGYTAEASLATARGFYRTARAGSDSLPGQGVLPQLPIGFCQANCAPDDLFCVLRCLDQGGGGSGPRPPTPRCRPACGPCLPDEDSLTGRSRLCIKANCNDYTRRC